MEEALLDTPLDSPAPDTPSPKRLKTDSTPPDSPPPDTPSPKPKRLNTECGGGVKTALFLIHDYSWKATVMLPTRYAFSLQDVKNALKKENLPVPIFPKGEFEAVQTSLDFQVAIFKHDRKGVVGCRRTSSEQHKILPPSIQCHKNITEFTREPNLRIGYKFLWGIEQPYKINEGEVLLDVHIQLPDPTSVPEPEAERTSVLTSFLRSRYENKNYEIRTSTGRNSIRYCRFSGGGDIEILKDPTKSVSAVLLVGGGQQEEQQTELHTPPKAGEVKSGVIENKGVSMQTEDDVTKQLMANMVLRAATTLHRFAKSQPIQKVEDLRYLVTYGCQMGPVHSLKLLKLHIDFEEERLVFFELFHLPPCIASGAYMDMVLNYVFEALDVT